MELNINLFGYFALQNNFGFLKYNSYIHVIIENHMDSNIILGVFKGNFTEIMHMTDSCSYPFTELIGDKYIEFDSIIHTVYFAARKALVINFLIDYIEPENILHTKDSITCQELVTLLSHPTNEILDKILFWDNGKLVSKEYVANKLCLPGYLFCLG